MLNIKHLWLTSALLCSTIVSAAPPIAVTILCDSGYPPYSYAENDEAKGLYTDILRAAFARMPAYAVSIRPVPWKRGLLELEHGKAFALYPPYYRPQERPWMAYSQPILEEKLIIVVSPKVARERELKNFPDAYSDLRIGLNAGFIPSQSPDLLRMVERGQIALEEARDNRSNLLKLKLGRIDAYINDKLSILWTQQQLQQSGDLPMSPPAFPAFFEGPTLSTEHGYVGFNKPNNNTFFFYQADFIRSLNEALTTLEHEGVIADITAHYSGRH
jgi:polar amino acid transport system substrate-binding protein